MLEAAIGVARTGKPADPPAPPPVALRPFLEFRKLPRRALDAARRVLDDDEEFRARVREVVDLEVVGEAGRLFLERPEGWRERYEELAAEAGRDAVEAEAAQEATRLRGELGRVRARLARVEADLEQARTELGRVRAELGRERRAHEAAAEAASAGEGALARARTERAAAVRELEQTKARDAGRAAEVRQATERLAEVEAELAARRAADGTEVDGTHRDRADPAAASGGGFDPHALGQIIGAATDLAARLSRQLDAAHHLLDAETPAPAGGGAPAEPPRGRPARRRPSRLPGGLRDDSPEAALALLRLPQAVVLVDGYNLTLQAWPGLSLASQRDRAVTALDGLGARTGCEVVVVFDGAEVGPVHAVPVSSRSIRVMFSPPEVEADDVVLETIGAIPANRPVVVVSDDHRVRDGAKARGANVVGVHQLLALLAP